MKKDYYKNRSKKPVDPLIQRIDGAYHRFLSGYTETNGVQHALSKGELRENPIKEFVSSLLPNSFGVTSGEVIDFKGNRSPQSDLILYRNTDGIPVLNMDPTIIQVESVMSITEVKSKITIDEYKDCLEKAQKVYSLKPFGKLFEKGERGRNPTSEDCRIFVSIFAYSSNIDGNLAKEYKRFKKCADDLGIDATLIDRIYILGKGIINPATQMYAKDQVYYKLGLFYYYSNLLQFILREAKRRRDVPYLKYFGRMSEGWKKI